jgi:hypothetical protein
MGTGNSFATGKGNAGAGAAGNDGNAGNANSGKPGAGEQQNQNAGKPGEGKQQQNAGTGGDGAWSPKLPEGFKVNEGLLGKALPLFETAKLQPEQRQQLVDLLVEGLQGHEKSLTEGFEKSFKERHEKLRDQERTQERETQAKAWLDQVQKDADLGGKNAELTQKLAGKALVKFDPKGELGPVLDETGLGNHPALVRFLAEVGKVLQEDSIAGTGAGSKGGGTPSKQEKLRNFFKSSQPPKA